MRSFAADETKGFEGNFRSTWTILQKSELGLVCEGGEMIEVF